MSDYKIEAHSPSPADRPHVIVTSDRGSARRYAAGLSADPRYSRVTVTVAGKVYEATDLGALP